MTNQLIQDSLLLAIPEEVLIFIVEYLESPGSLFFACKSLQLLSKDTYLQLRWLKSRVGKRRKSLISKALSYPFCTVDLLKKIQKNASYRNEQVPRHLIRRDDDTLLRWMMKHHFQPLSGLGTPLYQAAQYQSVKVWKILYRVASNRQKSNALIPLMKSWKEHGDKGAKVMLMSYDLSLCSQPDLQEALQIVVEKMQQGWRDDIFHQLMTLTKPNIETVKLLHKIEL